MKETIFISDFDGTITKKDFYHILLDDYIGEEGKNYYKEWKKSHKIGTEFLNKVFTWHVFTEEEKKAVLRKVEIDPDLKKVYDFVVDQGGAFHICSAGFRYYIEDALIANGLGMIELHTNEGTFRNGTFIMEPDQSSPFYSKVYGINKEIVALYYKERCSRLIFAGDSEPDFHAAKHADIIFAKNELAEILNRTGISYYAYDNFNDIYKQLKNMNENEIK